MARIINTNDGKCTESITKLQALVRGYLVRSKFARLRQEYNEIVKSFEGESAKVSWKNSYKPCFPTVDHDSSPTEETFDASTDHGKQKNISKATEKKLNCLNTSELFEETRPVQICVDESSKTTDKEAQDMSDGDFECIDKLNNSTATNDCCKSTKKITSKDSVNLNGMEFHPPSNPTGTNTVSVMNSGSQTLSNTETAQEISTDSTVNGKERNDGPANEGTHSEPNETLYPNDKLSLLKLREDLTMELLWIEQAIQSRINYLTMKENLED